MVCVDVYSNISDYFKNSLTIHTKLFSCIMNLLGICVESAHMTTCDHNL